VAGAIAAIVTAGTVAAGVTVDAESPEVCPASPPHAINIVIPHSLQTDFAANGHPACVPARIPSYQLMRIVGV
jgi:hypothetical protein